MAPLRWHLQREGVTAHDDAQLEQIVVVQRERAKTLKEMAANSVFFFRAPENFDEKALRKHVTPQITALLTQVSNELLGLSEWSAPAIHALISGIAARENLALGKLAQPIRIAVCGGTVSPPIDATLAILGRDQTVSRLAKARTAWGAGAP